MGARPALRAVGPDHHDRRGDLGHGRGAAAGRAAGRGGEAGRIGRDLAYPGWSADGSTEIPVNGLAPADLPYGLNAAFPWGRPSLGVGLAEGVGEIDAAAVFEVYSGTSFAARAIPVAAGRTVRTRHGMILVAEPAGAATAPVDRLVVPGARHEDEAGPELVAWAAGRGLPVELPHRDRGAGSRRSTRSCATWPPAPTGRPPWPRPSSPNIPRPT
nr:hypothetical protein GCM10020093_043380 [Planobispora longispora]